MRWLPRSIIPRWGVWTLAGLGLGRTADHGGLGYVWFEPTLEDNRRGIWRFGGISAYICCQLD